jgi:hypothetical protein
MMTWMAHTADLFGQFLLSSARCHRRALTTSTTTR